MFEAADMQCGRGDLPHCGRDWWYLALWGSRARWRPPLRAIRAKTAVWSCH